MKTYFPDGLDNPHLVLLRVQIEIADYWESPSSNVMRKFHRNDDQRPAAGHTKIAARATPASG